MRKVVVTLEDSEIKDYGSIMNLEPDYPPAMPAAVEARALDLIVAVPDTVMRADAALRPALQDIAGLLQLEDVFGGLTWPDAQRVAILLLLSVVNHADPVAALRNRAHLVDTEGDEDVWQNRAAVVCAITVAASVLEMV